MAAGKGPHQGSLWHSLPGTPLHHGLAEAWDWLPRSVRTPRQEGAAAVPGVGTADDVSSVLNGPKTVKTGKIAFSIFYRWRN